MKNLRQTGQNDSQTLGIGIVTPLYDTLVNLVGWGNSLQERLVRVSRPGANDSLVDVGAGTGTFCILAKKRSRTAKVLGVDPDRHVLEIAKQKAAKEHLRIHYIESTAQKLPFKPNSLDIAVSSLAFHHMPSVEKLKACREIYRVLKPGGHFVLADFGPTKNPLLRLFLVGGQLLGFEKLSYAKDNLSGALPFYMRRAGFTVTKQPPQKGVQILIGQK